TKDIDFQNEFLNAAAEIAPHVIEARDLAARNDGNNVSIDREARLLAENNLRLNIATNLLRGQIRTVREAIQEGKSAGACFRCFPSARRQCPRKEHEHSCWSKISPTPKPRAHPMPGLTAAKTPLSPAPP